MTQLYAGIKWVGKFKNIHIKCWNRRLSNNNYTVQKRAAFGKSADGFLFLHFLPTGAAAFSALSVERSVKGGCTRRELNTAKLRGYKTDTRRDSQSIQYQQ